MRGLCAAVGGREGAVAAGTAGVGLGSVCDLCTLLARAGLGVGCAAPAL